MVPKYDSHNAEFMIRFAQKVLDSVISLQNRICAPLIESKYPMRRVEYCIWVKSAVCQVANKKPPIAGGLANIRRLETIHKAQLYHRIKS